MKPVSVKPFGQASKDARELYTSAFPPAEQVSFSFLLANSARRNVFFDAFYDEGAFCGLAYWGEKEGLVYLLYLATSAKVRSKGYGSRIIESIKQHMPGKSIMLEIETLDDPEAENREQRTRRKSFYERNGFRDSGLRELDHGIVYDIMVFGSDITPDDFQSLNSMLLPRPRKPKVWTSGKEGDPRESGPGEGSPEEGGPDKANPKGNVPNEADPKEGNPES